jgi:hypothetical protein
MTSLNLLRDRFDSGVMYKRHVLKWHTVIEHKTAELGRYLVGRTGAVDFFEPSPTLKRMDSERRERLLSLMWTRRKMVVGD